jgi:tetratricopeptide (TPR) repeat protein
LAIDANAAVAANNLASLYCEYGGDMDKAVELARRAKEALPKVATVSDTLGWIYYKRELFDSAIPLLQEAVRQEPNKTCAASSEIFGHGDTATQRELSSEFALQHKQSAGSRGAKILKLSLKAKPDASLRSAWQPFGCRLLRCTPISQILCALRRTSVNSAWLTMGRIADLGLIPLGGTHPLAPTSVLVAVLLLFGTPTAFAGSFTDIGVVYTLSSAFVSSTSTTQTFNVT